MIRKDELNKIQFIIAVAIVLLLYLGSRLYALESLPVFIDEAIHIGLARAAREGNILASLYEGKLLSIILMSLSLSLPGSALWVTRFTSVVAGALTIPAIVLIGQELHNTRTGLLAAVIYIFMPYSFFYSRLALTDGITAAIGAWICYSSIKAVRERTVLFVVILAMLLILAPLVKATNFLFALIPLVTIFVLLPRAEWRAALARVAPGLLACLLILVTLYFTESATHQVGEKTIAGGNFISIKEVMLLNISKAANWYWLLLTPPLAILAAISLIWVFAARSRGAWFFLALFLLPTIPYILFATIWFPRYLAFSLVPLALLLAHLWTHFEKRLASTNLSIRRVHLLSAFVLGVLLIWPFLYNARLVQRPDSTPLPEIMSWQFIHGWPSGYGSKELSEFLVARADEASEEVYVFHPAYWSHASIGLEAHLPPDPGLELVAIGQDIPLELELGAERLEGGSQILFVIDSTRDESVALLNTIQPHMEMERIWHYPKPTAAGGLEVWHVERILTHDD